MLRFDVLARQMLKLVEKDADGVRVRERDLMQVRRVCACAAARQAGFGVALALQGSPTPLSCRRVLRALGRALQGTPTPVSSEPLTHPEAQATGLCQLCYPGVCQCHTPQMRMM